LGSTGGSSRAGVTDGILELAGKAGRRDLPCVGRRRGRTTPESAGSAGSASRSRAACSRRRACTGASLGPTRRRGTGGRRAGAGMGTAAHSCCATSSTCPSSTSGRGSAAPTAGRTPAPGMGTGSGRAAAAALAANRGTASSLERSSRAGGECMGHFDPSRGTRRSGAFMGRSRGGAGG